MSTPSSSHVADPVQVDQSGSTSLREPRTPKIETQVGYQFVWGILFLLCGIAVFVLGSPYFRLFPTNRNVPYLVGLTGLFLVAAVLPLKHRLLSRLKPLAFAFFIASAANLVLTTGVFNFLLRQDTMMQQLVSDKLAQFVAIVLPIMILTVAAGGDLGTLFVRDGQWVRSVLIGAACFVCFGLFAGWQAFQAGDLTINLLATSFPAVLVFVLANAFLEELWFRAIFLRLHEQLLNPFWLILITSVVFGLAHLGASYVSAAEIAFFLAIVTAIGFVAATIMVKTNSIWGAVLFHAGADLLIMIPILHTL